MMVGWVVDTPVLEDLVESVVVVVDMEEAVVAVDLVVGTQVVVDLEESAMVVKVAVD